MRGRGTGAFDSQNLVDANVAWKQTYDANPEFRQKMTNNLNVATTIRIGIGIEYVTKANKILGIKRFTTPYTSVSKKGNQYTEERVHMSEDLFWHHLKFADKPSTRYREVVEDENYKI